MITLIVARANNSAIGRDGDIPWQLPEDLKAFQRETLGGAVIMGRKTWDSLPKKPLPNRLNIVVSRDPEIAETVAANVSEAISIAQAQGYQRIYGIGGAGIYAEMLPLADRLMISEVDLVVADADTFFPEVDLEAWTVVNRHTLRETGPTCVLQEFLRK